MNSAVSLVTAANAAEFQSQVLEPSHEGLVLVDFWAGWCGPCKALAPVLEAIAEVQSGQLKVVKVDVDAEPKLAVDYAVRALPTLILFKDGEPYAQLVGLQSAEAIQAMVSAAV
jgi:thioredoxin